VLRRTKKHLPAIGWIRLKRVLTKPDSFYQVIRVHDPYPNSANVEDAADPRRPRMQL